ncbi:hypothetical protein HGM15179_016276 [Zosterops borbonicus]|uniref:Uncharacterized protein n=1 Tax=Zosterops borbonicus TaxID=364589 RepID=A0A8K1G343_9PASS|nr:hypothetical protein HGM15179_016276 [Zosterops borbonicus]
MRNGDTTCDLRGIGKRKVKFPIPWEGSEQGPGPALWGPEMAPEEWTGTNVQEVPPGHDEELLLWATITRGFASFIGIVLHSFAPEGHKIPPRPARFARPLWMPGTHDRTGLEFEKKTEARGSSSRESSSNLPEDTCKYFVNLVKLRIMTHAADI